MGIIADERDHALKVYRHLNDPTWPNIVLTSANSMTSHQQIFVKLSGNHFGVIYHHFRVFVLRCLPVKSVWSLASKNTPTFRLGIPSMNICARER